MIYKAPKSQKESGRKYVLNKPGSRRPVFQCEFLFAFVKATPVLWA